MAARCASTACASASFCRAHVGSSAFLNSLAASPLPMQRKTLPALPSAGVPSRVSVQDLRTPAATPCSSSQVASGKWTSTVSLGLYKQPIEECDVIPFKSQEGQKKMLECMQAGYAAAYFPLVEQFVTQGSPPLCGPATVAMILNSLGVDPGRLWKGPWRWFTEEMLVACAPVDWSNGITMDEFAHLAECNGTVAKTFQAGGAGAGVENFRASVRRMCAEDAASGRLAVNFHRATLKQTGDGGHYSPVAAYHEESDAVLILDVARFKYPPFWVSVPRLWEAMRVVDPVTGHSRGFVEVRFEAGSSSTAKKCRFDDGSIGTLTTFKKFMASALSTSLCSTGSDAKTLVLRLVETLCGDEAPFPAVSRMLSHVARMQLVQKPHEMKLAIEALHGAFGPVLEAGHIPQRRFQELWPSHPQIAVELTALTVVACCAHSEARAAIMDILEDASPSAESSRTRSLETRAALHSVVRTWAYIVGLDNEEEIEGRLPPPCRFV